jgi:acid phosphatase family membrane protein YuiD
MSIALSWVIVKIIKTIITWNKEKKFDWKELLYDGGMPSAHTVLVVSTAAAVYLERSLSIYFVISVVLALIVMNDAVKVRLVTQEQSKVINKLTKGKKDFPVLDEHVGHTPMEVLVGAAFGIIIPIIVYSL